MVSLQQQAQALGDPTRHAIFTAVADAGRPIGVAELNERFDLHANAIRQHLARLLDADLVIEATAAPSGRGRPRLLYEINPAMAGRWGTDGPYEELSGLLAEIISSGRSPVEVGRGAAPRLAITAPSGDLVADVAAAMARQGFDPEVRERDGGVEVLLRRCPFATAAAGAREAVCGIHLGIAEGLVGDGDARVTELVAGDPGMAGCILRIDLEPTEESRRGDAVLTFEGAAAG